MADVKNKIPCKIISWFFLLYFAILFAERAQSLVRTAADTGLFASVFDAFVNCTAIASLCAAVILLAFFNRSFWRSLFDSTAQADYSVLTVTSGVILVSGMLHTENTISAIQFASYGMLIIAMILRTAQLAGSSKCPSGLWYSLAYVTVFSMAIPVVYHYEMDSAVMLLFHIIETAVMLMLVVSFTIMLRRLFLGQGEDLMLRMPFVIMAVGDCAVLWLSWNVFVNSFVLIFAALAAVMFIVGRIIVASHSKKQAG